MKLLHDFIRLRAAGRRLLCGRRDARAFSYAVTVPLPLSTPGSDPAGCGIPAVASASAAVAPPSSLPPPRHLCLVSSH
ncbi:MAG: hypothetical protein KGJ32_14660 [Xanthomonadaceae bacterium]|nr:hypothetical protein [Xanthomonadaceae bacterium]